MKDIIIFPHWAEVFTLLHLAGFLHACSWWWMAVFIVHDLASGHFAFVITKIRYGRNEKGKVIG